MAKVKWRGGAMLSPVPPTMVTVSDGERENVFTVAWTGITNTIPPKTYISVRPSRYSYDVIKKSGVFAINLTTTALCRAADYCGVHTGAKLDKLAACGLHVEAATEVGCPLLSESPLSLECRVCEVIPMGTHDMFLADVVSVEADEALFDEAGALHLERASLCAYVHGAYYKLGAKIGTFGFSAAKKKKKGDHKKHGKGKN